jgi:hypothetical protein
VPLRGGTWVWTGAGGDASWSALANWSPASLPASDDSTVVIFTDATRALCEQDAHSRFLFGGLIFSNTVQEFRLGGLTNVAGVSGYKPWQFSGSRAPYLRAATANPVLLDGPLIAVDGNGNSPKTSAVEVVTGGLVQVPFFSGGDGDLIVKLGGGVLRVIEPEDSLRFGHKDVASAPEWRVADGVVELGVRTNRYAFGAGDTKGTNWVPASSKQKCGRTLVVGDAQGDTTSAVFRLLHPAPVGLLDPSVAVLVAADGLLDLAGAQDWNADADHWPALVVSNGVVRTGGSALNVRNGRILVLQGRARLEGDGASAVRWFDGSTNLVDGLGTGVVVAADGELVPITSGAASRAGVVFDVTGGPGGGAALTLTGHLGAGGSSSHLIKRGAGTMVVNNLTHAVRTNRVEAGQLWVNGVARCGVTGGGTAQWRVLTNATLGGTGVLSNALVVVQGGTLQPGGELPGGILTIASNVTLTAGTILKFAIVRASGNRPANSQLVVRQGSLQGLAQATLQVTMDEGAEDTGTRYRLIAGGGDYSGQIPAVQFVTAGRAVRTAVLVAGPDFVDVIVYKRRGTVVMLK